MSKEGASEGFATPEEAALASFPELALARVLKVKRRGDTRAEVLVDTEPSHPMLVYCERDGEQWLAVADHNV